MCIFIHKEENENCRKNTISAKRLFIYYNKKNINEKFHKKKLNKSTLRGGTYLPLLYFNFRVIKFICKKKQQIYKNKGE